MQDPQRFVPSWATQTFPSQVRSTPILPSLPTCFVNIDERVLKVLLHLESNQYVGIIGMGGSGKTTLTKAILHHVYRDFEATSFVGNMKDSNNVLDIQRHLLKDLKCEKIITNIDQGSKYLKHTLENKKVFVVLDDIGSQEQFHALVSPTMLFASGSKMIATSRNWQDLKTIIPEKGKMEMELFDKEQAKELFYKHAFPNQQPQHPDFEKAANKIIEACSGSPLSLEVLGSYLCGVQRLRIWNDALQRLRKGKFLSGSQENDRIWRTLRISYDNLNEEEKEIFLDIACFFCRDVLPNGMQEEMALKIWDCNEVEAELAFLNLKDRSLVQINKDGTLAMHDQLRDMGRMIACQERSEKPRIWNTQELDRNVHAQTMVNNDKLFIFYSSCFNTIKCIYLM